jgi:hypothetical protein
MKPIVEFMFKNIFSLKFDQSVKYKKIVITCCNTDARLRGRKEEERGGRGEHDAPIERR